MVEQIIRPANIAIKLLGQQSYKENVKYRPIKFYFSTEIDSGLLLINFMTSEMLFLDNYEKNIFMEQINHSLTIELVKKWFLVPENTDDNSLYNEFEKTRNLIAKNFLNNEYKNCIDTYTILTTTDCNARCFYCFELGRKRTFMTEKVALDVSNYIIKKCGGKLVKLRWFGGEPLYNDKVIDIICDNLKKNKINFASSMVSNGYLFSKDKIIKAKKCWNLVRVQITLDGTEKVYNNCKAFVYKNTNAFQVVTNNIESLLQENITVNIRLNMDLHNEKDLYSLVDYLSERYGKYKNFTVYAHLLYGSADKKKSETMEKKRELFEKFIALEEYIFDKKIFKYTLIDNKIRIGGCMASKDNTTVVLTDGRLGKCEYYSDNETWGSIYDDSIDYDMINKFKFHRSFFKKCNDCAYRPYCIQNDACPHAVKECDELDQMLTFQNFKIYMINTYLNFRNQTRNE